jgi:hypothetical protein
MRVRDVRGVMATKATTTTQKLYHHRHYYRALAGGESTHTEVALAFTPQASQPLALYPEGGGASPLRARAHPKYELPGWYMAWDPSRGAPELHAPPLRDRLPPAIQRDLERSHQSSTTTWCECSSLDT